MNRNTILPVAAIDVEEAIHWLQARTHQRCYVGRTPGRKGKRPDRSASLLRRSRLFLGTVVAFLLLDDAR
jgi:hypothetical protein